MVYVIFYLFFFNLSLVSVNDKILKIIFIASIIFFSFLFGFRYDVGADFLGYISYFKSDNFQFHIGPAYYVLSMIFKGFNLEYYHLNTFLVFMNLSLIFYTFRKNNNVALIFFIFLCLYFLGGTLGQIRQSIAMSILLLAFSTEYKINTRIFLVLVAFAFHYGAIIGLVLLLINNKLLNSWFISLFAILLAGFITKYFLINFFGDYIAYFESERYGSSNSVSLFGILERLLLSIYCIYCLVTKNRYRYFAYIYLLSIIIFLVYFDIEIISQRLSRFYKIFDIILIASLLNYFTSSYRLLLAFILCLVLFYKPIHIIKVKPTQYLPFKLVPYV